MALTLVSAYVPRGWESVYIIPIIAKCLMIDLLIQESLRLIILANAAVFGKTIVLLWKQYGDGVF